MAQSDRIPYKNLDGNSGIRFYESGDTFIRVWFDGDRGYEYGETRPGRTHVERMKRLAEVGRGFGTYINQNVRHNFRPQTVSEAATGALRCAQAGAARHEFRAA